MNKSLQSELDWITIHGHYYDSLLHAEAVKQNITKRYRIRELEAEIDKLDRQLGGIEGNPRQVS